MRPAVLLAAAAAALTLGACSDRPGPVDVRDTPSATSAAPTSTPPSATNAAAEPPPVVWTTMHTTVTRWQVVDGPTVNQTVRVTRTATATAEETVTERPTVVVTVTPVTTVQPTPASSMPKA
jgi:PBP1b-binding outer membrane lipoprotein LpoB